MVLLIESGRTRFKFQFNFEIIWDIGWLFKRNPNIRDFGKREVYFFHYLIV